MSSESEEAHGLIYALLQKLHQLRHYQQRLAREREREQWVRDFSYCFTGLSGMQRYLHEEVDGFVAELLVQAAQTPLGAHAEVQLKQLGKNFRVQVAGRRLKPTE
jgi:hypothetical protein